MRSWRQPSTNTLWLIFERLSNSLLTLLSVVAITRLMGPEAYGQFAYSTSVVAIALATGQLGLDGLLIKMLIERPDEQNALLGSVTVMKAAIYGPVMVGLIVYAFANGAHTADENVLLSVIALLLLVVPVSSSALAWLNAHEAFRSTAAARVAAALVGTGAKLGLIFAGLGIVEVGMAHAAMFMLEMLLLYGLVRFYRGPPLTCWAFKVATAIGLLRRSGYLFMGTVFTLVYANTDVIILRYLSGPEDVGLYALVPQIIMAGQLLPYAITLAVFPALVKQLSSDRMAFTTTARRLAILLIVLGLLTAACVALAAPYLISMVFGARYASSVPVLQIAGLALPFLFLRQLTTKLFICLEHSEQFAAVEGAALIINVSALLILIPSLGMLGAAYAIVATHALTLPTTYWLTRQPRSNGPAV